MKAGEWDGVIDESVQLVQILGVPGADAEDFGLVWEVEQADGEKLSFKLKFIEPMSISQGDETDYVFCLLNLQ